MAGLKIVLVGAALAAGAVAAILVLRGGAETGLGSGGVGEAPGAGSGQGTAVDTTGSSGPAAPATTAAVLADPSATSGPVAPDAGAAGRIGSAAPGDAQLGEVRVRARSTRNRQPVASAKAVLTVPDGKPVAASGEAVTRSTEATADASGQIALTPPAGTYTLTVEAPGFEPWIQAQVSAGPAVACDIGVVDLTPRPALRGTVTGLKGPALGCTVSVVNEVAIKLGPDMDFMAILRDMSSDERVFARTTAGPDGRFEFWFDELAPGDYAVRAQLAEHAAGFASASLRPDATAEANIALQTPATLAGRVLDPAGAGIAMCAVIATADPNDGMPGPDMKWVMRRIATVTDGEGRFRFDDVRPGGYMLFVGGGRHPRAMEQNVTAPSTEVEVRLAPGIALVGRVTDARTGRPIAGADVGAGGDGGLAAGKSDADGRYRLEGLTLGELMVMVQAKGYPPMQRQVTPTQPGDFTLDLALTSGITASGRVVRGDRTPVAGARVYAVAGGGGFGMGGLPSATTDVDGRFTLTGLSTEGGLGHVRVETSDGTPSTPQRVQATLVARADGLVQRTHVSVELVAGEEPRGIEIVCDHAARVSGRVVTAAGAPVAGATVAASAGAADPRGGNEAAQTDFMLAWMLPETRVETGPDGTFVLPSVRPGEGVRVSARREGFVSGRSAPFVAMSGAAVEGCTVTLTTGGRAVVQATLPDGGPAVGLPFRLQPDHSDPAAAAAQAEEAANADPAEMMWGMMGQRADADPQGRATFAGVRPGRYLVVAGDGAALALARPVSLTVADGQETVVTVALVTPLTIRGVVRDSDGVPVKGAWINATATDANLSVSVGGGMHAQSAADGSFAIPRVAPGSYQLHAWAQGYDPIQGPAATVEAGASGVELRLKRSANPAPAGD